MKDTYQTGVLGEQAAEKYLCSVKAMRCLARRFRARCGEIDLVMADGETIVFVEVKTRKNGAPGSGLLSVNTAKQKRISQAAVYFLMSRHWLNKQVRFDIVEITATEITHIPNAFQPGGMFYA